MNANIFLIRGCIASMPPEEQDKINECSEKIKEFIAESEEKDLAIIAVIAVAAEQTHFLEYSHKKAKQKDWQK